MSYVADMYFDKTDAKGDFMKIREQFGENSFDAVYAIEATCHAPDWEGIYSEIKHVLKPGGKVSGRQRQVVKKVLF